MTYTNIEKKIPENHVISVTFVNHWYRIRNNTPPPISTPAFRGSCLLTPKTKNTNAFPSSHNISTICSYRYYKKLH